MTHQRCDILSTKRWNILTKYCCLLHKSFTTEMIRAKCVTIQLFWLLFCLREWVVWLTICLLRRTNSFCLWPFWNGKISFLHRTSESLKQRTLTIGRGKYHCTADLLVDWFAFNHNQSSWIKQNKHEVNRTVILPLKLAFSDYAINRYFTSIRFVPHW